MHLSISVIKFDEKLSILASLSLSINRRNHGKSKRGGGGFPPPPAWIGLTRKVFCISVQLAPLDKLLFMFYGAMLL